MIYDINFRDWAIENGLDVSYNVGSNYYNSQRTRVAYYAYCEEEYNESN